MIKTIMVFKKSGLCLFHKNFFFPHDEPHELTGFFSAINIFSNNLFKEKVQSILLGNSKILFRYHNDNIFVIITDKDEYVDDMFNSLITNFISEYTPEKDEKFRQEGQVPEFQLLDDFLDKCLKIPTFQNF
ncbi:MAG: hypothetical protein EAX96_09420 [Candidatus Lokiarchaeota archaeon]|nr:hypothetical protein [Candidatus Lokiarchaeota archaeon]